MTAAAPTFRQIKAQVENIRRTRNLEDARVFGISSPGRWTGERLKKDGGETYLISQCDSPLELRLALKEEDPQVTFKVLITALSDDELEADIRLRLTKRRLLPIRTWDIVKDLFHASRVDPRIARYEWMADLLLDLAPSAGYPAAPAGVLDAETAWGMVFARQLGIDSARPDLVELLAWSMDEEKTARFRGSPAQFREAAAAWIAESAGAAAILALEAMRAPDAPPATAVGVALGVLFHEKARSRLEKAVGRLEERLFGGQPMPQHVAARWAAAAAEAARTHQDSRALRAALDRADELLASLGADDCSWVSDVSPLGFRQRLVRYGDAIGKTLERPSAEAIAELRELKSSVLAHGEAERVHGRTRDRVEMAYRLVRWLGELKEAEAPAWRSLEEAARQYAEEGGFIDWARHVLSGGDPVRELAEVYGKLRGRVTRVRERWNEAFGTLLADWIAAGARSAGVVPVEDVLDTVVAPLAEHAPVLVLCLDGLSHAILRELLQDLAKDNWVELRPAEAAGARPILAALPSTTEVCRTSLFTGKVSQGAASDERAGFSSHVGLLTRSRGGSPPKLFHKMGLQPTDERDIDPEVRDAIASARQRIVGVVVNAIDDHLHGGDQVDVRWTQEAVKPLATLLFEARMAGRCVVVVGDHGHVIEYESEVGGGEDSAQHAARWRGDDGRLGPGEVQFAGPRVLIPGGRRLIAPWSEKVRYGSKQSGYHGGASLQEMVVPLVVLSDHKSEVPGWTAAAPYVPGWWYEPPAGAKPLVVVEAPRPAGGKRKPSHPAQGEFAFLQGSPGSGEPPQPAAAVLGKSAAWIEKFLRSPILAEQKKLGGRGLPADADLARLLDVVAAQGGKVLSPALAQKLGVPTFRIHGLVAVFQRVLNVDGYPVLTRDDVSDTVELNLDLLEWQFGLK